MLVRLTAALGVACGLLSFVGQAQAEDRSLFVDQIGSGAVVPAPNIDPGQGTGISNPMARQMRNMAPALPGGDRNTVTALQAGTGNRGNLQIIGRNNGAILTQLGVNLSSTLSIQGGANSVAVDQRGANLDSDISVDGANKTIVHLQRGNGNAPDAAAIELTGTERETMLVLDTERGRRVRASRR